MKTEGLIMRSLFCAFFIMFFPLTSFAQAIIADHNSVAEFDLIPENYFAEINSTFRFYYAHTSHGSQIITGLNLLENENAIYDKPLFVEIADDLGHLGDTSWVPHARTYLNNHPEINMVMFSWCGGVSDNTQEGIDIYLDTMNSLEGEFPDRTFIYMTGHLFFNYGYGSWENTNARNQQIRDYVNEQGKILFDFADIESYDPAGTFYPNETDACNWCSAWCSSHSCPSCPSGCAHSHCFNCYIKGKAFWWLMARIAGWADPSIDGNDDGNGGQNGDGERSQGEVTGSCGIISNGGVNYSSLLIFVIFTLIAITMARNPIHRP